MPTLTYALPVADAKILTDSVCGNHNYQGTIHDPNSTAENLLPDIPNPETRVNFAKRIAMEQFKRWADNETSQWQTLQAQIEAQKNIVPLTFTTLSIT